MSRDLLNAFSELQALAAATQRQIVAATCTTEADASNVLMQAGQTARHLQECATQINEQIGLMIEDALYSELC